MAMKNHFEIQTTFVVALSFFESALKYTLICRTLVILGQRLSGYNLSAHCTLHNRHKNVLRSFIL